MLSHFLPDLFLPQQHNAKRGFRQCGSTARRDDHNPEPTSADLGQTDPEHATLSARDSNVSVTQAHVKIIHEASRQRGTLLDRQHQWSSGWLSSPLCRTMCDEQHNRIHMTDFGSVVKEAIQRIDPEGGGPILIASLEGLYDDLVIVGGYALPRPIQSLVAKCVLEVQQTGTVDDGWKWIQDVADVYRCIIVSSFLLLQLKDFSCSSGSHDSQLNDGRTDKKVLQESIERSILLLRMMFAVKTEEELGTKLMDSRYPLLNALFQEPLVPLSSEERATMWTCSDDAPIDVDGIVVDDNDDGDEDGFMLPSKQELIREEHELLEMANRPISSSNSGGSGGRTSVGRDPPNQRRQRQQLPHDVLRSGNVRLCSFESERQPTQAIDTLSEAPWGGLCLYRCGVASFEENKSNPSQVWLFGDDTNVSYGVQDRTFWIVLEGLTRQDGSSLTTCDHQGVRVSLGTLQEGALWMEAFRTATEYVRTIGIIIGTQQRG